MFLLFLLALVCDNILWTSLYKLVAHSPFTRGTYKYFLLQAHLALYLQDKVKPLFNHGCNYE